MWGMRGSLALALACAMAIGCAADSDAPTNFDPDATTGEGSGSGESGDETGTFIEPLPPLSDVPLTTEQTIVPSHAVVADNELDPRNPDDLQALLDDGFGMVEVGPGESPMELGTPAAPGPDRQRLVRFVHLADPQLIDDEGAMRSVSIDLRLFPYAFRPQEAYTCNVLNAAVRTINAIHEANPLDFVVLGGDNVDSAQANEHDWFLRIMDGANNVHCDSGDDDDAIEGPANDPKDPFGPSGLDLPWRWVTGNHDILVQGVFVQTASRKDKTVGDQAENGTRDWSEPGGPTVEGTIVPDDRRALLSPAQMLTRIAASADGHGIDAATAQSGRANYVFDAPGGAVRFVVVDSATSDGATDGVILGSDVEEFIRPALESAQQDGVPVVVMSHHPSGQMSDGSGLGGTAHPDALEGADWQALLGEYSAVIMHLAAHVHRNRARLIEPVGGSSYWEVVTAALADYPHQMRLVEIFDEDNGLLTIRGISVDYATDGDPLAAQARARGVADVTSGWLEDGAGGPNDRNVVLWLAGP